MTDAPVQLERASRSDHTLLSNLIELYAHDLSDVFPMVIGADGRFGYPALSAYWAEPERRFAFLIRAGATLAGFALVTIGSPLGEAPTDLDVAEFFVLRNQRRAGVGRTAAFLLWDRFPGQWVVRVSEGNRGALAFWPDVVAEYSNGAFRESQAPGNPHAWRVFRLRSRTDTR